MKVIPMKIKIIAVIFGLVLLIPISAQSQISLLDTEKVKDYLTLNPKQMMMNPAYSKRLE